MRITKDDQDAGDPRPLVIDRSPVPAVAIGVLADRIVPEPTPRESLGRTERVGIGAAVAGHVALFVLLSANLSDPPPLPVPGSPMTVTIMDPGIASFGEANGDDAPPPPTAETSAPTDAQAAPSPRTDAAPDPQAPTTAVSDAPSDAVPEPKPADAPPRPAEAPSKATSENETPRPARPLTTPSQDVGTGALAVGARTHGDAKGLDASLSAVVGRAVATRMRACWEPPTSGVRRDTASILVVRYTRDGMVDGDPVVTRLVDQKEVPVTVLNQWETSAVDALRRCSPLGLSPVLYPYWREVEVQLFGAPGA